jgi:hypothetical protein
MALLPDWYEVLLRRLIANCGIGIVTVTLLACEPGGTVSQTALSHEAPSLEALLPMVTAVPLAEDARHPIGRVTSMLVTPWGDIVVSDAGMREVKVFDAHGRFKHLLARTGSGPGEFNTPSTLELLPGGDGFLLSDFTQPRVLLFAKDSIRASRTIQYVTPGLMVRSVVPWRGDSLLALGVTNTYRGDSLFDGAILRADGSVARPMFRRPREFVWP